MDKNEKNESGGKLEKGEPIGFCGLSFSLTGVFWRLWEGKENTL